MPFEKLRLTLFVSGLSLSVLTLGGCGSYHQGTVHNDAGYYGGSAYNTGSYYGAGNLGNCGPSQVASSRYGTESQQGSQWLTGHNSTRYGEGCSHSSHTTGMSGYYVYPQYQIAAPQTVATPQATLTTPVSTPTTMTSSMSTDCPAGSYWNNGTSSCMMSSDTDTSVTIYSTPEPVYSAPASVYTAPTSVYTAPTPTYPSTTTTYNHYDYEPIRK